MKGYMHSFESLAAVDGLGLRCAVFLSGCPLKCAYCHNPDTWCGVATEIDPSALVKKIERYKPYFREDGGVTFSGGEPLCQAEFIQECIPLLREKGINYAVDTSGAVELTGPVKNVLENAQTVILDLKFPDDESYVKYTGKDMSKTLDILAYLEHINKDVWIRTVVVPGVNDSTDELEKYLVHVKGLKCVKRYEILGFHTMGFFKYDKAGIENPFKDKSDLDKDLQEHLQKFVNKNLNI